MRNIRIHLQPGLKRYFQSGIRTGGFLQACLENDPLGALNRAADQPTRENIPQIFEFLENRAPAESWGSPEKVEAWIKQGGEAGRE